VLRSSGGKSSPPYPAVGKHFTLNQKTALEGAGSLEGSLPTGAGGGSRVFEDRHLL